MIEAAGTNDFTDLCASRRGRSFALACGLQKKSRLYNAPLKKVGYPGHSIAVRD